MLHKTRGIVLHSVNYSETSLIVTVYTESFGMQSYLLKGIRGKKSTLRPAHFQTFSLLDLVVYHTERKSLHPVREARIAIPLYSIFSDVSKSSIALFLAELLYRSIREEEAHPALFEFLWNSIVRLDAADKPIACFHLVFALHLTRFLGFQPKGNRSESVRFFNLQEGSFQSVYSSSDHCLDETESTWFFRLQKSPLDQLDTLGIPGDLRRLLLEKILLYYRFHLPGIREIRTHEILHNVLS